MFGFRPTKRGSQRGGGGMSTPSLRLRLFSAAPCSYEWIGDKQTGWPLSVINRLHSLGVRANRDALYIAALFRQFISDHVNSSLLVLGTTNDKFIVTVNAVFFVICD